MASYFTHSVSRALPVHLLTEKSCAAFLATQPAATRAWANTHEFTGKPQTCLIVPDAKGGVLAVLAGGEDTLNLWSIAHLPAMLPAGNYRIASDVAKNLHSELALGFALAQYQFTRYKKTARKALTLVLPKSVDIASIQRRVEAIHLVRDLINTPASDMGPLELSVAAKHVAKASGATFKEIVGEQLLKQNYPAIHAVGRAAPQAPRLIELTYGKKNHPLVTLVGKGVTFDTGGLDLKPLSAMKLMKKDMGGAALVLGLAQLMLAEKLPIRLRVLIAAVENSIGGDAFRPQDIIYTRKGLTMEIGSTDAEGRVILADALAAADEEKPDLIIDAATLTGAARTALGPDLPALYSNRDDMAHALQTLSLSCHDPLWHMPLWQPYAKHVNGTISDITNTPNFGFAGSITAALFLERFVSPATPWIHLDTYAWNAEPQPGRPVGGEALGLRALFQYLVNRYA